MYLDNLVINDKIVLLENNAFNDILFICITAQIVCQLKQWGLKIILFYFSYYKLSLTGFSIWVQKIITCLAENEKEHL